jgi:signal transduction histidine kinase
MLSFIVAWWISRKMSKPIIRLTKSAERLVKGALDENFYDSGFTEINQLASAFNYAANELRSLDKYRREFIANVSHDLKTPLTIIKLYGEMIKDVSGSDPSKRNSHCDTIIKEADWLMGMVGEIVELSKLESNNTEIAMTAIDISRCLKDTLTGFQILSEKGGYCFETNIDDDLLVLGNEPMLRRTLYNLISNAVNFTGEDKRVIISLKHKEESVRFEVTDTGEGIPKEKQGIIWDRYYKSNETHKRAVVGTGMGLSIVKNVLVLHKADYGVISDFGKGSTFWFELKMKY